MEIGGSANVSSGIVAADVGNNVADAHAGGGPGFIDPNKVALAVEAVDTSIDSMLNQFGEGGPGTLA
jgi:hypothetical protein